jgi:hypothetical protein
MKNLKLEGDYADDLIDAGFFYDDDDFDDFSDWND